MSAATMEARRGETAAGWIDGAKRRDSVMAKPGRPDAIALRIRHLREEMLAELAVIDTRESNRRGENG